MLRTLFFFYITFLLSLNASAKGQLFGFTYMAPNGKNAVWDKLPVKLCISLEIPKAIREQFSEAALVWNKTFKKEIFDTSCQLTGAKYAEGNSAVHGVYWVTSGFEKLTEKTSLARTVVEFDDSGKMHDADILLNGQYYDWSSLPIDAQTVLVHELGHVLGLKHFFLSLDSAMNYYPYVAGYVHRTIGEYERLVVSAMYLQSKAKVPAYLRSFFSGQIGSAISHLEKRKMKTSKEYYALGVLYKSDKKFDAAKTNFRKALESNLNADYIRLQLGDVLWSLNEVTAAETEFLKVLEENPKSYEALANLGSIYLSKGDSKKGIEFLKKSLTFQPAHWAACALLFKETKDEKYNACAIKYGPDVKP